MSQDESNPLERHYWCFISYRHTDNKEEGRQWANWLHQALETYEVPKDLVGKKNERGEIIPSRIFPVFRDEVELGAGSLSERINRALEHSRTLAVICSPRVLESTYVSQEIRHFRMLGKTGSLYAVIIDGEPGAPLIEGGKCFPDELRYHLNSDGRPLIDRQAEPLAADFRLEDGGQGWTTTGAYEQQLRRQGELDAVEISRRVKAYASKLELGKLKLIAGVLGVPLGVLKKRDQVYQLQQARRRFAILSSLLLLAVVGTFAGWFYRTHQFKQRIHAEAQRTDIAGQIVAISTSPGEDAMDRMKGELTSPYTTNLVRFLSEPNVSVIQSLVDLSDQVNSVSRIQRPFLSSNMSGEIYLWDQPPTREKQAIIVSCDSIGNTWTKLDAPPHDAAAFFALLLTRQQISGSSGVTNIFSFKVSFDPAWASTYAM